jgi:uncharacterized surface protein with fasciclin (FAS1) repeats
MHRAQIRETQMMTRKILTLCLACGLATACNQGGGNEAAANKAAEAGQTRQNLGEALAASADHSSFVQALQSAGLTETLNGAGPYTVLAPTNAAFAAIPEDVRNRLMAADQRDRLVALLSYHIVPGTVTAEDLGRAIDGGQGGRAELATVTGDNLSLTRDGQAIVIGDGAGGRARVTSADQVQSNGVVHSIDAVLMPAAPR